MYETEDAAVLVIPEDTDTTGTIYVDSGSVRKAPPRPSNYHSFNYQSKRWEQDTHLAEADVRQQRNLRLVESDWTQLPDVPQATKEVWATYRQALRDITDQPGFPLDVVWPEPPSPAP
jgi:hypothetical protein